MASLDYRLNPIYTIKECSSCGTLYTKSRCCSKGGVVDKFVRDPNKTPDSSQRPPQNCPKCGNPVDGLYCRQCALLRKKLKEVWSTICYEDEIFQDFLNTSESSNDKTNVVNAPQEPFVFNQDPGENSSQRPPHIDHHCCYGCGDSLDEPCHNQNVDEFPQTLPSFHPTCYSGNGSSFTYDSTPNFVDDSPNVFNPPSQPQTYSHEFCGNDAHYGHDSQQVLNNFMSELRETFQAWLQQRQEQVVNLDSYTPEPSPFWKIPIYYNDDDDEESFTHLRDIIISELPPCIAITPVLLTEEPVDSLIMEDKHLDTIPATKLDEVIKSSVEDLVYTPSESDGISESECDLPVCDNFSPKKDEVLDDIISIPSGNGNDQFNAESSLIESVLNRDNVISSPKIDFLLEEFAGELALIAPIPSGIVEADFDPKGDIRFIENLMYDNSFPRPPKTLKDDSETVIDSNNDYSSSNNNSLYSDAETKVATWDDLAFKLIILG
ncbi:hypothetical protein Tco_1125168 [Tanacetum coccineum]|uniref:Uncharacterized protein n=1 Tax=Tanacetum coccineum TaxID=301880 RepID=A0ABQ5J8B1_9ASTR